MKIGIPITVGTELISALSSQFLREKMINNSTNSGTMVLDCRWKFNIVFWIVLKMNIVIIESWIVDLTAAACSNIFPIYLFDFFCEPLTLTPQYPVYWAWQTYRGGGIRWEGIDSICFGMRWCFLLFRGQFWELWIISEGLRVSDAMR